MPISTEAMRAEQQLLRACYAGADLIEFRQQLLRRLRAVLPVDAAFFATADPDTLLFTSAFAEEPLAAATEPFLINEFGVPDANKFAALATSPQHVGGLDDATRNDRLASPRYRDIMRPLGLGDELRAALIVDHRCWGYLCLHREDGALGFTESETSTLARLVPHVATGLRLAVQQTLAAPVPSGPPQAPGVVVLAADLTVLAVDPQAEHLLAELPDAAAGVLPLPVAIYGVARTLQHEDRDPTARVPTTSGGWLTVHATPLRGSGPGEVAIIIEPAAPAATAPIFLAAHGLTVREQQVATQVLRGASTRSISGVLHISESTVQDHLKSVFDKVGVRSRRELVAQLLGQRRPSATSP